MFWTACPTLPLNSLKMGVRCLNGVPAKAFPQVNTCLMTLFLPVIHRPYEEFRNSMDKAVSMAKYGFVNI